MASDRQGQEKKSGIVQRISTMMQTQEHNVKMQKKVLRNANRTISSFNCKMFSVIIWIYKSFTFHLFGNGRLLRRLIRIHLYTQKFFYHFCTNFHNTRLSTLAILDKLPSILFPCKNHPTPCSYMFHQSCAFCFVLILPVAPSGKYFFITSLNLGPVFFSRINLNDTFFHLSIHPFCLPY